MRIITGRARGIKLDTLPGELTRPTSERSKEAIFSMLQFDIADSAVLDLFAGSGQMGLEAASRGARAVHLVERDRGAYEIVSKNLKKWTPASIPRRMARMDVIPSNTVESLNFKSSFCIFYNSLSYSVLVCYEIKVSFGG